MHWKVKWEYDNPGQEWDCQNPYHNPYWEEIKGTDAPWIKVSEDLLYRAFINPQSDEYVWNTNVEYKTKPSEKN
jgi:hypothetical protein